MQAFSVYVDTLFVCTATALMILITQQYNVQTEDFNAVTGAGTMILQNIDPATVVASPAFTQMALHSVFGPFGQIFAGLAIFFFAFILFINSQYPEATSKIVELSDTYFWKKFEQSNLYNPSLKITSFSNLRLYIFSNSISFNTFQDI